MIFLNFVSSKRYFSQPDVIERTPNLFLVLGVILSVTNLIGNLMLSEKNIETMPMHTSINNNDDIEVNNEVNEVNSLGVKYRNKEKI